MLEELLALGSQRRGIRRLADPDQRGRSVRQRLRRRQPELQDPGADGPQRAEADPRVRIRRDPAAISPRSSAPSCRPSAGARAECLSWLFWQMGSAPYLGGGFGHFYAYAPTKIEYAIDRFAMEVKRQLDVLDRRLAESRVSRRRRIHDRRHRGLAVVRRAGEGPALRRRRVPAGAGLQERPALDRRDRRAPGGASAGAWSTGPGASRRASCTSATTPATSKRRRRTRLGIARQRRAGELRCSGPDATVRQPSRRYSYQVEYEFPNCERQRRSSRDSYLTPISGPPSVGEPTLRLAAHNYHKIGTAARFRAWPFI